MNILLSLTSSIVLGADLSSEPCPTTREYTATYRHLQNHQNIKLPEARIKEISMEVAKSCQGSARRFINAQRVFTEIGLSGPDILNIALKLAQSTDEKADAYLAILQKSYLERNLDLDIGSSIKLAEGLTLLNPQMNPFLANDYSELVQFLLELGLPKGISAQISGDFLSLSKNWDEALFPLFSNIWQCSSHGEMKMSIQDRIKLALQILKKGPQSARNFCEAIDFARQSPTHNKTEDGILRFALKMSEITNYVAPAESKEPPQNTTSSSQ